MSTIAELNTLSQDELKKLIDRRHPGYDTRLAHWRFCEDTYNGGRSWFDANIFKYFREGGGEYLERLKRAYRFNHTREVVDLVNKYIFKGNITRSEEAPENIQTFWSDATAMRKKIPHLMRVVSQRASVFGRIWVVVDNNFPAEVQTNEDVMESGGRIYAYCVNPYNVLDFAYGEDGELLWIMLRENVRDDSDPLRSTGESTFCYRLWTRTEWVKFSDRGHGSNRVVTIDDFAEHDLGAVPVVSVDDRDSDNPYFAPALIEDIAYLDKAIANYLSNLDAIIQDQTFSQLVIPAQGVVPDVGEAEDGSDTIVQMGTKRVFTYDVQATKGPEYISPDPKQAELIVSVVNKIINEIYHSLGMSGERTKEDNATGIDNSSGVAKAYDFERLNTMLASKAQTLEEAENRICRLVAAWAGEGLKPFADTETYVHYPATFDVRDLYDEFDIATRLSLLDAPKSLRREQMTRLLDKLYPHLLSKITEKIKKEIEEEWLEEPEIPVEQGQGFKKTLPGHENSQGQNNKNVSPSDSK